MNRKASPQYFDGHKFITISDLPVDQSSMFSKWIRTDSFIPNRINGEKLIKYEDYEHWFELHYTTEKNLDQLL